MSDHVTAKDMMSNLLRDFYMTEGADANAFERLEKREYDHNMLEFGLTNYNAANAALKTLGAKMANALTSPQFREQRSSKLWRDVAATSGDITRLREYKNARNLLEYVIASNNSVSPDLARDSDVATATRIAQSILTLFDVRVRNRNLISSSIDRERKSTTKKDQGIYEAYYVLTTIYLIMIVDGFYGRAITAKIDYSTRTPTVSSVYFKVKDDEFDVESNMTTLLNAEHKFFTVKQPITESFAEISKAAELNEGVFDVIFAAISTNKLLDSTLLLPIYAVRMLVYAFFYAIEIVSTTSESLEQAIAMRSKQNITASEFDSYKKQADKRQSIVNQGALKAEASIRSELESDRKAINNTSLDTTSASML